MSARGKSDQETRDAAAPEPETFSWHKCPDQGREHHTMLHESVDALLRDKASLEAENGLLREELSEAQGEDLALPSEVDDGPDFLDEMIEEFTARNPEFPRLLEEACRRRREGQGA